ncbi:MAG: GIY-YIG nuclease family protein [Blastocatellia bacterium]|nr:GIY-YIG nuclease family protein [Blastocatellia bacterium]
MNANQKALKKEYQQSHRPMGIWAIRNLVNDKVLIGAALNLPGILNRHKFALEMGGHKCLALQTDWNELGSERFTFEILDEISPRPDPAYDYRADLLMLEDMWLENLAPYGEKGYNEPKKTREERLRMIMANRQPNDEDRY